MMNSVNLTGRLTADPELTYTPSGVAVTKFSLAVNRSFLNANGEREADFIRCVAWRQQAETMANHLNKGSLIAVEGRIQTGSYEAEHGTVWTTDIMVERFHFLEAKQDEQPKKKPYKKKK